MFQLFHIETLLVVKSIPSQNSANFLFLLIFNSFVQVTLILRPMATYCMTNTIAFMLKILRASTETNPMYISASCVYASPSKSQLLSSQTV